jgi:hypothetical protein
VTAVAKVQGTADKDVKCVTGRIEKRQESLNVLQLIRVQKYLPTPRSRVFPRTADIISLVKNVTAFIKPENSSSCSKKPAIGLQPEQTKVSEAGEADGNC